MDKKSLKIGFIGVGFMGIEYHLGALWAWLAIGIGFVLRIMLPLTIGTFFGALDVLGWPWYGALALTAPGLIFILPAMISSALDSYILSLASLS